MDPETKTQLRQIHTLLGNHQDTLLVWLVQGEIVEHRRDEMAENLESLAERIRRIKLTEK